jgi:hypothetical protein
LNRLPDAQVENREEFSFIELNQMSEEGIEVTEARLAGPAKPAGAPARKSKIVFDQG